MHEAWWVLAVIVGIVVLIFALDVFDIVRLFWSSDNDKRK